MYTSTPSPNFHEFEIPDLLKSIRPENARRRITGMLLYIGGSFFQVLEGAASDVDTVYALILGDARHHEVTLIIREPILQRDCAEWTMLYQTVDPVDARAIVGDDALFGGASGAARITPDQARKLFTAHQRTSWQLKSESTSKARIRKA